MGFLWGWPEPLTGPADLARYLSPVAFRILMTTFRVTQCHRSDLPACGNSAPIAEYLLFPAAVPVLDCNYRSFNSARALIEAAARPCRASARDWP